MDNKYIELKEILNKQKLILQDYINKNESVNYEDENIIDEIYLMQRKIRDISVLIIYYSKPSKEGYLKLQTNGRYKINDYELTCGDYLEVKIGDKWYFGTVECDNGHYYLHNEFRNIPLNDSIFGKIRYLGISTNFDTCI